MNREDPTVGMLYTEAQDAITARLQRLVPGSGSDRPPLMDDLLAAVCINLALEDGRDLAADDLVDALRIVPDQRARLELDERKLLEAALDRGATWESLAERLGWRSRQALQQRYRRLGGTRTWPTRRPAETRPPWFGRLLRWERSPEGWRTRYAGREVEIIKLSREAASAWGRGTHKGWHFTHHPDEHEQTGFIGPGLGTKLDRAKYLAEAWLILPAADRRPYDTTPDVLLALSGGGAVFGRDAPPLTAWPENTAPHQIDVTRRDADELVATITPAFEVPDRPDLDPIGVTWTATLADGTALASTPTWRDAAAAVAAADTPEGTGS
ncbi:hypothetical protein REH65_33300 (plasmid) [Saccharopolyspora sp. ID03-671]|uniref:hypothetical protein n=1 Tax=Saccharopolyspora sp. ID03-671 TaxID=3073066 RepID=UPI0032456F97